MSFLNAETTEEALRSEKQFSDTLIETAPSFVVVLDTSGYIMLFNKAAENISGYKKEEVLNKNWFDIFIRKDEQKEVYKVFRQFRKKGFRS